MSYQQHGWRHDPVKGTDPVTVQAADPPWIMVYGSNDSLSSGGDNFTFTTSFPSTNDDGTYYTFGSIPSVGTNGLTINVAGVYETYIRASFFGTSSMTQASVEASILELGYEWDGDISPLQIHNDALQKGWWQSDALGANRPRWHPSWYKLLIGVDSTDVSGGTPNLTLNWVRHVAPDDTALGEPSMYVRRLSGVVDFTNF